MNKLELAQKAVVVAAGISTSHVVKALLKNNISPENKLEKIECAIGVVLAGMMASAQAEKFTKAQLDSLSASWKKAREKTETPQV